MIAVMCQFISPARHPRPPATTITPRTATNAECGDIDDFYYKSSTPYTRFLDVSNQTF